MCKENDGDTGPLLRVDEEDSLSTTPGTQNCGSDLDVEESVAERVARFHAHQAGARASSSPENPKMIRQSPRLSAKSDMSAGSDMRSGSQPSKLKLTFADAVVTALTPGEKKARERVEARKRRNRKHDLAEGRAGKQDDFVLRLTYNAIGRVRELISLVAGTDYYPPRDWQAGYGKPDQG